MYISGDKKLIMEPVATHGHSTSLSPTHREGIRPGSASTLRVCGARLTGPSASILNTDTNGCRRRIGLSSSEGKKIASQKNTENTINVETKTQINSLQLPRALVTGCWRGRIPEASEAMESAGEWNRNPLSLSRENRSSHRNRAPR